MFHADAFIEPSEILGDIFSVFATIENRNCMVWKSSPQFNFKAGRISCADVLAYAPAVEEEPKATIESGSPRAMRRAQYGSGYCKAVNLSGTAHPKFETCVT